MCTCHTIHQPDIDKRFSQNFYPLIKRRIMVGCPTKEDFSYSVLTQNFRIYLEPILCLLSLLILIVLRAIHERKRGFYRLPYNNDKFSEDPLFTYLQRDPLILLSTVHFPYCLSISIKFCFDNLTDSSVFTFHCLLGENVIRFTRRPTVRQYNQYVETVWSQ